MKKFLSILLILIFCLVFIAIRNSSPSVIISDLIKKGQIQEGQLRYKIYLFGVLPVGEAILGTKKIEDYNGQKVYHLNARAESLRFFSKFFSGHAILDSFIDISELNPILFKQKLTVTGKPDINKEVFYDQKEAIMSISGVKRQILPNTQDPLSAIFNLRRLDFDRTKNFEMNINSNQKNYVLKGTTKKRDLSINKKRYKIVLVKAEIRRRDKSPYHKSSVNMVLLKENANTPVLINIFASGVLINVKLVAIE
jgi:hypothetical protein